MKDLVHIRYREHFEIRKSLQFFHSFYMSCMGSSNDSYNHEAETGPRVGPCPSDGAIGVSVFDARIAENGSVDVDRVRYQFAMPVRW